MSQWGGIRHFAYSQVEHDTVIDRRCANNTAAQAGAPRKGARPRLGNFRAA